MTKSTQQRQTKGGGVSQGRSALAPAISKSKSVEKVAHLSELHTPASIAANRRRVGRPPKGNQKSKKTPNANQICSSNGNKQRGRGRPRKASTRTGASTSNRRSGSRKRKTATHQSPSSVVLGLQSAGAVGDAENLLLGNTTPYSSSGPQAMASQLMKQLPARSQLQTSATSRGRSTTFWADLHVTYFNQICDQSIDKILNQVRHEAFQQSQPLLFENSGRFGDHFSFYDYYKDGVVQGVQDLVEYHDQEEVRLLQKEQIIDRHFEKLQANGPPSSPLKAQTPSKSSKKAKLVGLDQCLLNYNFTPVQANENFSTDFFQSMGANGSEPSKSIEEHLSWLEKAQELAQNQIKDRTDSLSEKIRLQQQTESHLLQVTESEEASTNLSSYFARQMLHLEMLQLAESIVRIKAEKTFYKGQTQTEQPQLAYFNYPNDNHKTTIINNNQVCQDETNKKASQSQNQIEEKKYLLSMDKALNIEDFWVTQDELAQFNKLRQEMASRQVKANVGDDTIQHETHSRSNGSTTQTESVANNNLITTANQSNGETTNLSAKAAAAAAAQYSCGLDSDSDEYQPQRSERKRGFDMDQLDFCHHCLQLKQTQIHVRCRYQSTKHRVLYPPFQNINGIKIYNADMHCKNLPESLILKRIIKDRKRRHNFEENLNVCCGRKFCSFCLKNFYDINFATIKNDANWICPYCTGQCFCSRCRRRDQLTTVRGYLISLNTQELAHCPKKAAQVFAQASPKLNLYNLGDPTLAQLHPVDKWLIENFERTVRCSDLSNNIKDSNYFLDSDMSIQQHIQHLMRSCTSSSLALHQNQQQMYSKYGSSFSMLEHLHEPALQKRLRAEVRQFIQMLHKDNICVQTEGQDLVSDIKTKYACEVHLSNLIEQEERELTAAQKSGKSESSKQLQQHLQGGISTPRNAQTSTSAQLQ